MTKKPKSKKVHIPEVIPAEHESNADLIHNNDPIDDSESVDSDEPGFAEELNANEAAIDATAQPTDLVENSELPSISKTDPLYRYLAEIRRHPLLAPEEEFRLAQKLIQEGDVNAAKALVQANLRLVVKIAMEYRSYYSNLMDLIQEGNIGLMKAVSKFDPTKGARLGYYASWWIKSYILKYLLDNFRLVKLGTTQAQKKLFYHLMREKERLEAQGLLAGPKLLAEKLNVREKDVVEMEGRLSARGTELALDAPIDAGEKKRTHLDVLADTAESPDESLSREQLVTRLRNKIPAFLETLNDKERRVFQDRLIAEQPQTLQEVADNYGLTRERARQIEAKVIVKLRDFLKEELN